MTKFTSLVILTSTLFVTSFFAFSTSLFAQGQECVLEEGQFRNRDYGLSFPVDWFSDSVGDNSVQPYVYIDLKFSPGCVGNGILYIREEDNLGDDLVLGQSISVAEGQRTIVLEAGDWDCELGSCEYYADIQIGGVLLDRTDTMLNNNIEYDCAGSCDDQQWELISSVSDTYGQYWHPSDPDLVQTENGGIQMENDGGTQTDNEGGVQIENNEPLLSVEDLETIDNPLGDGTTLPEFFKNIISIFVRFMIPIIVLAYIYTGFRYVLAQGNPTALQKVHQLFLWVVVGSAIVLGAWTIATILTTTINAIL